MRVPTGIALADTGSRASARKGVVAVGLWIAALAGLAAAWRFLPPGAWLETANLIAVAEAIERHPLAPLGVVLAYVLAGLLVVPVNLLIGVTAVVFGPALAIPYALIGATSSAAVTFFLGRITGRQAVRRLASGRLNAISRQLAGRGLLAIVLVRLVPVAPYSVVNVVAGATNIGWRDFLLGTLIGITPGVVMMSLFVDRAVAAARDPGSWTFSLLAAAATALLGMLWLVHCKLGRSPATIAALCPPNHPR